MSLNILYATNSRAPALAVHGGAGPRATELSLDASGDYRRGLSRALDAGRDVLTGGGSALDAVCAAVVRLEDDPLFNAGRGAALTSTGVAELDAAVMGGDGRAGAVAASHHARNPVLAARAVRDRTRHVLLIDPGAKLLREWGIEVADQDYFVTEHRLRQIRELARTGEEGPRSGTVGAVALDAAGHVACATSTGGMAGQADGRVGDSPLIGAGTYASDTSVAISCTGDGEAYIQGVVAHEIAAQIRLAGCDLIDAVDLAYADRIASRGATGGTIAVTPGGDLVIAHNSAAMFAGYWHGQGSDTFV